MCGRYYVDDDTAREIEKVVRQADERMRQAAENSVTLQPRHSPDRFGTGTGRIKRHFML